MSGSSLALSNLRGIVIVIVVAFHASLAYLAWLPAETARFDQAPYTWQAFPIVDRDRWMGFDLFCAWQDLSLMSLMFFLSGLLTAPSLLRKGSRTYVIDRLWRIGLPFALAVAFLSPIAIVPVYLARTAEPTLAGFWQAWLSLPFWPSGPQWFLWQLLVLSALAATLHAVAPRSIDRLGRFAAWACERPATLCAILIAASALAYLPLALAYSPWAWGALGPFSLQLSRPAHYLLYFFAGVAIGRHGLDRGLLACDGPLARNWIWWLAAAVVAFFFWAGLTALTMPDWSVAPFAAQVSASIAFSVACAMGCLVLLALCLRFCRARSVILDSLSANAYSIYLVHYVFVVWLQYALLGSDLHAIAKAAAVFSGAMLLSWAASVGFDRFVLSSPVLPVKQVPSPVPR
jgi:surface polysaccharide O-acyltransferase-like enzyme